MAFIRKQQPPLVQLLWTFPKDSCTTPGVWVNLTAAVITEPTDVLIKTKRALKWGRKGSKGMGEAASEDDEGRERE